MGYCPPRPEDNKDRMNIKERQPEMKESRDMTVVDLESKQPKI